MLLNIHRCFSVLVIGVSGVLAGCVGEGSATKTVAEATGFATTANEPKAWVVESRSSNSDYIPIGTVVVSNPLCSDTLPRPGIEKDWLGREYEVSRPVEPCKRKADFKKIEAGLQTKGQSNIAQGERARSLGKALPPPAPAKTLPAN
ncbi:MAG: hypothetical protein DCF30_05975 [Hyphomicrobiales bacterium]|nr:MAG: hypothetical protein DCF30_05975 [Hyphomicrobiales bacterium]